MLIVTMSLQTNQCRQQFLINNKKFAQDLSLTSKFPYFLGTLTRLLVDNVTLSVIGVHQ